MDVKSDNAIVLLFGRDSIFTQTIDGECLLRDFCTNDGEGDTGAETLRDTVKCLYDDDEKGWDSFVTVFRDYVPCLLRGEAVYNAQVAALNPRAVSYLGLSDVLNNVLLYPDLDHHDVLRFLYSCTNAKHDVPQRLFMTSVNTDDTDTIKTLLLNERIEPCLVRKAIDQAILLDHISTVAVLMNDARIDIAYDSNRPVRLASEYNRASIVALLLTDEMVDPSDNDNFAIRHAAVQGFTDVVAVLLTDDRVQPQTERNYAICMAACNGHTSTVAVLLTDPRVDPSDEHNYPIRTASENGHGDTVALLLFDARVDPTSCGNWALCHSARKGYIETVAVLLSDTRVDPRAGENAPMVMAIHNRHYGVVALLIDAQRERGYI